jgi:chemotaxis signal transduction protein
MDGTRDTPLPARGMRRLLFRSGGERFSLDVESVLEIAPPQEVTPVPLVPDSVAGIINHRGTIVTVIRFARLGGLGEDRPGAIVLLRLPEMAVGLAVESVEGIDQTAGVLAAAAGQPPAASFLRRARDPSGRTLQVIDPQLLAEAICRIPEPARATEGQHGDGHD